MCGIVGGVSQQNLINLLLDGLQHLEYRGYDSAGIAVVAEDKLVRVRCLGKVSELKDKVETDYPTLVSNIGIAHTRWATHGVPSELNAHPHVSDDVVLVHNGIIENHDELRNFLLTKGYVFHSQTDTEVIAHLIDYLRKTGDVCAGLGSLATPRLQEFFGCRVEATGNLLTAIKMATCILRGTYGIVVMDVKNPKELYALRSGSPLVLGVAEDGNYLASDQLALIDKTNQFIYLDEGDIAQIKLDSVKIFDKNFAIVQRPVVTSDLKKGVTSKGEFPFYMLKEVYEQPEAILNSIEGRITHEHVLVEAIGPQAHELISQVEHIQIIACGTSYHSGMVAKYWIEEFLGISCDVEIASEYRYRKTVTRKNSLLITLTQSGETADVLAGLRKSKDLGYLASMTICNVPSSSVVRESDLSYITRCGVEVCVASTKAFTSQLVLLLMFVQVVGLVQGTIDNALAKRIVDAINSLPRKIEELLENQADIQKLSQELVSATSAIFIGRDVMYPIAKEGDLKLKEISYIHSEAFAGGELKHGPLALVDAKMPVIALCPDGSLLEKMKSNIEEVIARDGNTVVFTDRADLFPKKSNLHTVTLPAVDEIVSPILYSVAMQLLAYYVATAKGLDPDRPRNLAKSVTVE